MEYNLIKTASIKLNQVISECEVQMTALHKSLSEGELQRAALQQTLADYQEQITALQQTLAKREEQIVRYTHTIQKIIDSTSWQITSPLRCLSRQLRQVVLYIKIVWSRLKILRKLVSYLINKQGLLSIIKKTFFFLRYRGFAGFKARIQSLYADAINGLYIEPPDIIQKRLQLQLDNISKRLNPSNRKSAFSDHLLKPKISILMPVYKAPIDILEQAIASVTAQIYPHWELCIVDDGSQSKKIDELLLYAGQQDPRIKVKRTNNNLGISNATNQALKMATGEFIALLDNDDLLTHDALECMVEKILSIPDVDILYSDECKINQQGNPLEIFSKPDWSPSLLFNCMYIGHLTVYRKSLLEQVGLFRSQYDFSQDYDLALRATEVARNIIHINSVLYSWRTLTQSAAAGGKPYARKSNIAALQDAINRRKYHGTAVALPAVNRVVRDASEFDEMVSIIIPSDNKQHIEATIDSIISNTSYKNYEIILVTQSTIIKQLSDKAGYSAIVWVSYDLPFNFSDKCNEGFKQSNGQYLIFYNDDVQVITTNWIECILEYGTMKGVGIVGAKLLYENQSIQHAGMVTGVRHLIGTAFHSLPDATAAHYNFAQSVREVSIISGACLGIKRDLFQQVDMFDSINTPIRHSDVDLCFRVRKLGLRCVYTPYAKLFHIGHQSLANFEMEQITHASNKDKADLWLLKNWPDYISNDPYYPKSMRELLFHDSPEYYEIFGGVKRSNKTKQDILLISHDLSESGAPRIVLEIAKILHNADYFVVVASPADGPIRYALQALGINVIIDQLLLKHHPSVLSFARNFDTILVNTIAAWQFVLQLSPYIDVYWYIHESKEYLSHLHNSYPQFNKAFAQVKNVWCGSEMTAETVKKYTKNIQIMEYGLQAVDVNRSLRGARNLKDMQNGPLKIAIFGSYEPRKGQDFVLNALSYMQPEVCKRYHFQFYGRILDQAFFMKLQAMSNSYENVLLNLELDYETYIQELLKTDLVIVPSREDTLPLVSLHALSAGKPLLVTKTTGTSKYIVDKYSGFIIMENTALGVLEAIEKAWNHRDLLQNIGLNGLALFEKYYSSEPFIEKLIKMFEPMPA